MNQEWYLLEEQTPPDAMDVLVWAKGYRKVACNLDYGRNIFGLTKKKYWWVTSMLKLGYKPTHWTWLPLSSKTD